MGKLIKGAAQWALREIKNGECIVASSFSFRTRFVKGNNDDHVLMIDGKDGKVAGRLSYHDFLNEYGLQVESFEPYVEPPGFKIGNWIRSRNSNNYYEVYDIFKQRDDYLYELRIAGANRRTKVVGEEDLSSYCVSPIEPDLGAVEEGDELYSSLLGKVTVTNKYTEVYNHGGEYFVIKKINLISDKGEEFSVDKYGCFLGGRAGRPYVYFSEHQEDAHWKELIRGDKQMDYDAFNDRKTVAIKAMIMKNFPNICHMSCPYFHGDYMNQDVGCLLFEEDIDGDGVRCQSCIKVFGSGEEDEER